MHRLLACLLVVATTVIAGCTSGSASYEDRIIERINEMQSALSPVLRGGLTTQEANRAAAIVEAAADDIDAIEPPADDADLHRELVTSMRAISTTLRKVAPVYDELARSTANRQKMTRLSRQLTQVARRTNEYEQVLERYVERGYRRFETQPGAVG